MSSIRELLLSACVSVGQRLSDYQPPVRWFFSGTKKLPKVSKVTGSKNLANDAKKMGLNSNILCNAGHIAVFQIVIFEMLSLFNW